MIELNKIYNEDCLQTMARMDDGSIDCCITSPPYWGLRNYQVEGQVGLESTPEKYSAKMVLIFSEVKRVLKKEGTLWLNLGDSYAGNMSRASEGGRAGYGTPREGIFERIPKGLKSKDLIGIPWRIAFALQADGWYLRSDIIWHKPNPMPESVTDRPTKAHEYIFLMSKNAKYYYDADAIREDGTRYEWNTQKFKCGDLTKHHGSTKGKEVGYPEAGRNKRTVWTVTTQGYKEAHFATFPEKLIEPCVLAGCPKDGIVYDPFGGAMTTALVSLRAGRDYIMSELSPEYCKIGERRLKQLLDQKDLFYEKR